MIICLGPCCVPVTAVAPVLLLLLRLLLPRQWMQWLETKWEASGMQVWCMAIVVVRRDGVVLLLCWLTGCSSVGHFWLCCNY